MIKQIAKKYKKSIIVGALLILLLVIIINLYNMFMLPFIQPYFFKMDNIEKIIGINLPQNAFICEYKVVVEPDCTLNGIKGIKEIYTMVQIDEDIYKTIQNKFANYSDESSSFVKAYGNTREYESLNNEDVDEIMIKCEVCSSGRIYYHKLTESYSVAGAYIYIILTKTIFNTQINYYLYVFGKSEFH